MNLRSTTRCIRWRNLNWNSSSKTEWLYNIWRTHALTLAPSSVTVTVLSHTQWQQTHRNVQATHEEGRGRGRGGSYEDQQDQGAVHGRGGLGQELPGQEVCVCVCVYVWSTTVLVLSCALQCYILANCDCRGLSDRIATLPLGIARSASSRSISPPSAWTTASNPCRYLAGRFESTSGISLVTRRFLRSAMSFTRTRRGFFSCSMSPLETPSMFWVTGWQKRRSSVLIWKTFQSLCAQIRWFSASTCGNVLNSNYVRFFLWYILAQVDKRRDVSEEEGREFASSRGFIYFETSACTGANVTEVFEHLFQKIVANT